MIIDMNKFLLKQGKVMKIILGLILFLNLSQVAWGFDIDVIGPFPPRGSLLEQEDFKQMLIYQKTRTIEECAEAQREANSGMQVFFAGPKGPLTAEEASVANKKLRFLTAKVGTKIFLLKTKYARLRPYLTNSEIKPCIELESSKSYPSGHTTLARVYARVLSVMYPERAAQLMKRADEIATNRVLGGVHHPSDIEAGKKLGDALAEDYLGNRDSFLQIEDLSNSAYEY